MELVLLWLGINALIGYALGKPKNEVGASILTCILLGPIGWLLCILNKGKLRKCPYCAEDVKPEAVVCRHCGRDLPQIPSRGPHPISPKRRKWEAIATVLVVLVVVGGLWLYAAMHKQPIPAKSPGLHSIPQNAAIPEVRRAKPVSPLPLKESLVDTKTQPDPIAEYWKQFDRGSNAASSHAEIAANMRAREAAARAKVSSEAAKRHTEYLALVPHQVTKAWIAGIRTDKIGVDLLVKHGVTERQLADLIRWYVGCNSTVVTVYDDAENARKRESMLASYMCGEPNDCKQFERFTYPKGKDWTVKEVSL